MKNLRLHNTNADQLDYRRDGRYSEPYVGFIKAENEDEDNQTFYNKKHQIELQFI